MEWPCRRGLTFGTGHKLTAGVSWKDKSRDYTGTRFYYDISDLHPEITDIYSPNDYLNFENVSNGSLVINRQKQPKDSYEAGNRIVAGYVSVDLNPLPSLLINAGVRYESSRQWVRYYNDQSLRERRDIDCNDLFPALNLRYNCTDEHQLRLSLSRTITRPSFVEMAPFLYQESYGSVQLRGNEALLNSYNYNLDLRYEYHKPSGGHALRGRLLQIPRRTDRAHTDAFGRCGGPYVPQRRQRPGCRCGDRAPQGAGPDAAARRECPLTCTPTLRCPKGVSIPTRSGLCRVLRPTW